MIKSLFISVFLAWMVLHVEGQYRFNFYHSWGYNLVNIENAAGSPKFDAALFPDTRQLVEWDQFYYSGELQVFKQINDNELGVALGANRLYYWEERYRLTDFTSDFYFDWGTIWTYDLSVVANRSIDDWILEGSSGIHYFPYSGAITVGLGTGFGRKLWINDQLFIPLIFKMDLIVADGTTVAPNLGIGLSYVKD